MSTQQFFSPSVPTACVLYISWLYIIGGLAFLLVLLMRAIPFVYIYQFNLVMGFATAISLIGLILSKQNFAQFTINRLKFVAFFGILLSANLVESMGMIISIHFVRFNAYAFIISGIVGQFLVGASSCVVLSFASYDEDRQLPRFSRLPKYCIGMSGLVASVFGIARIGLVLSNNGTAHVVLLYLHIGLVGLVGAGMIWGILVSIFRRQTKSKKKVTFELP